MLGFLEYCYNWSVQTVVEGILTEYSVYNKISAKPILILHGWGQSSKEWEYIAQALSKNHSVITLDLPGFGASSLPPAALGVHDYSLFVKSFLSKIGVKKVVLIGHSLGGKISIHFSSLYPDRVSKLFLISPSGIDKKSFFVQIKLLAVSLIKIIFFWVPQKYSHRFIKIFASRDYIRAGKLSETFKKVISENVRGDAAKMSIKTVIIWSEKDEEVPLSTSKVLKSLIKNSTLRVLWGVRHSANTESPEKLFSVLTDYL
jgi:pimeloyl-ACP methyl ester carboxylesterase